VRALLLYLLKTSWREWGGGGERELERERERETWEGEKHMWGIKRVKHTITDSR